MARVREVHFGDDGDLCPGEDKYLDLEILAPDANPHDPDAAVEDVAGQEGLFVARVTDRAPGVLLSLSTSIVGTYSATRSLNTQRVRTAIADTDTEHLEPGTYRYSCKRTDAGGETIWARGNLIFSAATQR